MPYEYRRMTPEQRRAVVDERRRRGYPIHSPPHPFADAGGYLISAANYDHVAVMHSPERRSDFQAQLMSELHPVGAEVHAWVILPNHYHVLLSVGRLEHIAAALQRLHGRTAREWNLSDGLTAKRRVWFKYTDRAIRGDGHWYSSLNYVHFNPVKHGLVTDAYAWPWSSLAKYLEEYDREWLRQTWQSYPPRDLGTGWDD
jgi:putative transposase